MKFYKNTDVGVVRKENQDRVAIFQEGNITFAILCDGMGGHKGGSHASAITVAAFEKEFNIGINTQKVDKWFSKALKRSKKDMERFASHDKNLLDMGTTMTGVLIVDKRAYIINIGDSRTYAYNGMLHQVTKDHNLRNHYIEKYGYSAEQAAKVAGAMALTSALGPQKTTSVDSFVLDIVPSTKYLILTSDGIHDYVPKPVFEDIIAKESTLEEKTSLMIARAIKNKSSDNLSIIIIEVNS